MPSDNPEDLKKAFEDAKSRYRLVGVSGIETVGDHRGKGPQESSQQKFEKGKENISVTKGVVTFGKMQTEGEIKLKTSNNIQVFSLQEDISKVQPK